MTDRQNTVVATTIVGLVLILVFLCPWRIESSGEIAWSPIYQPPLSYVRSYDTDRGRLGSSRIEGTEAHIAFGILALEVLAVGAVGGGLYVFVGRFGRDEERPPPPLD